jgi:hypothetical protein
MSPKSKVPGSKLKKGAGRETWGVGPAVADRRYRRGAFAFARKLPPSQPRCCGGRVGGQVCRLVPLKKWLGVDARQNKGELATKYAKLSFGTEEGWCAIQVSNL